MIAPAGRSSKFRVSLFAFIFSAALRSEFVCRPSVEAPTHARLTRGSHRVSREHEFDNPIRFRGQRERCYLVRCEGFEPEPRLDLAAEGVSEVRCWTAGSDEVCPAIAD